MHGQLDRGHANTLMQYMASKVKGDEKKWFGPHVPLTDDGHYFKS
jgi:hypothetical protein